MNLRIVRIIYLKEMLDTLRDKRTVVAAIVMPTLIYPALFIFGAQALMVQRGAIEEAESRVAVSPPDAELLREWVGDMENVVLEEVDDPAAALENRDIDAYLVLTDGDTGELEEGGSLHIEIRFDATEMKSREAADRLEDGLEAPMESLLDERLTDAGLTRAYITPLDISEENVAPPAKTAGSILGGILPLLMVMMVGLGAFYPAVDLTAGEKERGTFETLLSTPTGKLEIVGGKFLAVFTLSIITGLLNLGSMVATFSYQFSQMASELPDLEIQLSANTLLVMLLVMFPLALFISAVMMAIAVCARSFKEAQNFVTPFFLLILFPAILAAVPGTKLTATMAFIPIANASLLFKDLLTTGAPPESVFIVFISTAAYAALGLLLASWLFQREEVLLAEENGVPLTFRRSAFAPRNAPTPSLATGLFLVVMLLIFYAGSYAQSKALFPGLLFTEIVLIFTPVVLVLLFTRIDLRNTLNLRKAKWSAVLLAACMGVSWVILNIQIGFLQERVLPMSEEVAKKMGEILQAEASGYTLWGSIAIIALSPAICEEVLFRGALLSAYRERMPGWATVLLVGFLFGIFHLSLYRLLPTGLTGIILTYVVLRTGSILPAMVVHFLNNSIGIILMAPATQERLRPILDLEAIEQSGIPVAILAVALAVFIVSTAAFHTFTRKRPKES